MNYFGSKRFIAKELFIAIQQNSKLNTGYWVEPFCGGCNMLAVVPSRSWAGGFDRYANDSNHFVIALFRDYLAGKFSPPKEISESLFKQLRNESKNPTGKYSDALIAFAALSCSFGATWFGGYARSKPKVRKYCVYQANYCQLGANELERKKPKLQNIVWSAGDYSDMVLPTDATNTIIYCDPPYRNSYSYYKHNKFDYPKFYAWLAQMAKQGYKVYISETYMPDETFKCIWEKKVHCQIDCKNKRKGYRTERLYSL